MKLQKLFKKLALPVFALVVVGMLAACSSPAGGGSDNSAGGGGKEETIPELTDDVEYEVVFDSSLTATEKTALAAAGIKTSGKMTGAEIEALKAILTANGYTYTENDGTIIIKKKASSGGTSSGDENKDEYIIKYEDLVIGTCDKKKFDEMPAEAGTKNGKVATMSPAYITETLTRKNEDKGKEYVAVIFYGNDEPGFLEQEDLQKIESLLEKNTDYKISSDKKVIVITESGLVKFFSASTEFVDTDIQVTPLFDVSELTVAAERIAWTEGTWLLKIITDYSDGTKAVDEDKIKADSSGIKYTEMIFTQTGTVTESMPKAQFDMLTDAGKITGNKYTYTIAADEKDIAEENEHIVSSFNRSISYLKTNADKTKYYWKTTGTSSREGVKLNTIKKYYLEKKSGTSTPVILPDSSDVNEEEKPVNKPNEPEQNGQSGSSENSSTYNIKYNDIYLNKDMPAEYFDLDAFSKMFDESEYTMTGNTITFSDKGLDSFIIENGKDAKKTYVTLVVYDNHMLEPLIQDDFNTLCNQLTYKTDYETFAGTKIIILTDSGYEKAKDFFYYEGSKEQHSSEEHSGNSYKGKINPDKIYKVYNKKEYDGTEFKGSTFIEMALMHDWKEDGDYYVDNEKFTILFKEYIESTNPSQPEIEEPESYPTGISPEENYTLITGGEPITVTGYGFVLMIDMYNFDENDYSVKGTEITIKKSGLEKMAAASENIYDLVYNSETFEKIPLQSFKTIAKKGDFSESDYSIDEEKRTITLSDSGYELYLKLCDNTLVEGEA